ncbi:hypothetical protein DERP_000037 [Dermatophagoides pteronyssinus]|uniref:Transmembrane protein n=1 Tax=Dermatophagoides pteronyssinus TaxID=6956 RepID=A0ABQ8IZ05_DERPT|nr:hypothetical protein DERP_000037 [Dermatophagoides pteronyssinus]
MYGLNNKCDGHDGPLKSRSLLIILTIKQSYLTRTCKLFKFCRVWIINVDSGSINLQGGMKEMMMLTVVFFIFIYFNNTTTTTLLQ